MNCRHRWNSLIIMLVLGITLFGFTTEVVGSTDRAPFYVVATVTPNTFNDDFDEVTPDSNCSLREALQSAMGNEDFGGCSHTGDWEADNDKIILAHGTYELNAPIVDDDWHSGDLDMAEFGTGAPALNSLLSPSIDHYDIAIMGHTTGSTVDANSHDRVFELGSGISVSMENLIITGGHTYSEDARTDGGAIYIESLSTLKIVNSNIYGNGTINLGNGGGIYNIGDLTLDTVILENNHTSSSSSASRSGQGGGIFNAGDLAATDASITDNITGNNTGTGMSGDGAGIYNAGYLHLNKVTIAENVCGDAHSNDGGSGGGIYNVETGTMHIHTSTISSNAGGTGGVDGGNHSGGNGGGIYNNGTITIIDDSTITNNQGGYSSGTRDNAGGGLFSVPDASTSATLKNTILAGNTADHGPDCWTGFVSNGYNLVEDDLGCTITGITDTITDTDPMLGPLADLGGLGRMHSLLLSSPAIDAGPNACNSFDQRSLLRPKDGNQDGVAKCDIGAYEAYIWRFLPLVKKP